MDDSALTPWQSVHAYWTGLLSLLAVIGGFFGKRLIKELDDKVGKEVFDIHAKSVEDKLESIDSNVKDMRDKLFEISKPSGRRRK